MTAVVRILPIRCSWCTEFTRADQYAAGNLIPDYWRTTWTVRELRYRASGGRLYPPPRKGQMRLALVAHHQSAPRESASGA